VSLEVLGDVPPPDKKGKSSKTSAENH